ncbi:MAG: hypothetical protein H6963_11640 [Chromatiaceae bacterium]|nr:hypothetical protein [Chromatiaceae bacterium]
MHIHIVELDLVAGACGYGIFTGCRTDGKIVIKTGELLRDGGGTFVQHALAIPNRR